MDGISFASVARVASVLVALAACKSKSTEPGLGSGSDESRSVELDAAVDALAVAVDAPVRDEPDVLADLPALDVTIGDPSAHYDVATLLHRSLPTEHGLALLAQLGRAGHGALLDRARTDDAWRDVWRSPRFWAVVELASETDHAGTTFEKSYAAGSDGCPPDAKWADAGVDTYVCMRGRQRHGRYFHRADTSGLPDSGHYVEGRKQGIWIEGSHRATEHFDYPAHGAYVRGKRHGFWTLKATDGLGMMYVVYEHGIEQGYYERREHAGYFEAGTFIDGKKHGTLIDYRDGKPRWVREVDRGVKHGVSEWFGADGTSLAKSTFVRGTGEYIELDDRDRVVMRGQLHAGVRHGRWLERGGAEGDFDRDRRVGIWTYTRDGVMRARGTWTIVKGKHQRTGTWEYWHDNGALFAKGNFVDDPEGEWTIYDTDGVTVVQKQTFVKGKLVQLDGRPATAVEVHGAWLGEPKRI